MKKIPGNMWSLGQFKEFLGGGNPVTISKQNNLPPQTQTDA